MTELLEISDLTVHFQINQGAIEAVDHINLTIRRGEVLGLVGESGSGKSVTSFAILRLIRPPGRVVSGSVHFDGVDLGTLPEEQMRRMRGAKIAMVSQTPRTALNPLLTVGKQISRLLMVHAGLSAREADKKMLEMLRLVRIPAPEKRAKQYPHQLSGGMCQRIMIAMALATSPQLLLADEPTTGLDVSIAAKILDLLRELSAKTGAAIMLVTHDLGVVAEICDRVAVMHAGQVVECAPVRELFHNPAHPYTKALVRSIPRVDRDVVLEPIPGSVPSLVNPPSGCRYAGRCEWVMDRCRAARPAMIEAAPGHVVACYGFEERRGTC
ncbi:MULTISPECIES: ABC transporter ATP-binding protein [unclassified Bradyrhizobium]|uniref:ABC transporter ATP-binding protein n=1 Tax=unclassified Bradyrhizobium TaxID=2631580 RepID=UPI001CD76A64|nr:MULTISPECIES: ABC transporter ATP-binding protein [unclassified Bradyrhizobium]MCA1386419.1 ABC transporter ATP-binding protein [Bradyrhizobium sp. BRP05]MCA1394522.1 ABC transporter ATP-binding protein [Bradyrhizobium sp. IC3123]MCA1424015.1 ABC transporter ATP-binding protein [Bradyrhizobium sp. BRP23]MCA1431037.1 ABC transporter ATP-binding protein [Bradyrhizobium sp. NBAIM16]MCA1471092.1 ABC transporter ATP-binding protein [Bradyrhizobium sp. IC3195]